MAKSRAQQAAIAISMKKAGKKPKMQSGGTKPRTSKNDYRDADMYAKKRKALIDKYPNALYMKAYDTYSNKIDSLLREGTKKEIKAGIKPKVLREASLDRKTYKKGGSTPAWQRKEGKSPSGGLNAKGRASLKAAGHDIKAPQPEGGPRKKSFCARMSGMKKKLTSAKTANDPNSRINKSLRKWKC